MNEEDCLISDQGCVPPDNCAQSQRKQNHTTSGSVSLMKEAESQNISKGTQSCARSMSAARNPGIAEHAASAARLKKMKKNVISRHLTDCEGSEKKVHDCTTPSPEHIYARSDSLIKDASAENIPTKKSTLNMGNTDTVRRHHLSRDAANVAIQKNRVKEAASAAAKTAATKKTVLAQKSNEIAEAAANTESRIQSNNKAFGVVSSELFMLIKKVEWQSAQKRVKDHQAECMWKDSKGQTPLHLACSIGSIPTCVTKAIMHGWGKATLESNVYGEVPLHEACRNSQMSCGKVKTLLDYCPESASVLNSRNWSPLHVACVFNAMFPNVVELANADPSMLLVKDNNGNTPASLAWNTFAQNPFSMIQLTKVDQSFDITKESSLCRFWVRMAFLVLKTYCLTHRIDAPTYAIKFVQSPFLLHAVLEMEKWPLDYIIAIIRKYPNILRTRDSKGDLPLHVVSGCRKMYGPRAKTLLKILSEFPAAASIPNKEGRFALNIGIESGLSWENGLKHLFLAAPAALNARDTKTHLYPFMLMASSISEHSDIDKSVNTLFQLLKAQPEVIQRIIPLSS